MSESILSQMRLSMRLDGYENDYSRKSSKKNPLYKEQWDAVWRQATSARAEKSLTPELLDRVRLTLEKLQS